MAAILRGICPAIGKWSDLEFKNFFELKVWNTFRTLHSGGRLIFWVKDTSVRDYLLILKLDQLKAMCADFVTIDWFFDHHEPRYLSNDTKWPSFYFDIRCSQSHHISQQMTTMTTTLWLQQSDLRPNFWIKIWSCYHAQAMGWYAATLLFFS